MLLVGLGMSWVQPCTSWCMHSWHRSGHEPAFHGRAELYAGRWHSLAESTDTPAAQHAGLRLVAL